MRRCLLLAMLALGADYGAAFAQGWPAVNTDTVTAKTSLGMPILITDLGADKTGVAASDTAINNAIARCQSAGGGNITIPQGTFTISTSLTPITTSFCRFVAEPGAQISVVGSATVKVFTFTGPGNGAALTLTAPVAEGTSSFPVTDASALAVDDYVTFRKNSPAVGTSTVPTYSFTAVVKQIVGNTVSLTNAFPATFSPGDAGLQIHKWVPIRNVGIEGPLLIDASSHTTNPVYGVTVTDEALSRFDGIRGRKLNYVIMTNDQSLHSGYANTFENLGADRSGDTQYDAFYFLGETSSQFANLQARGGLGAIWGIQWSGNSYINASNLLAQCQGDNITPGGRNIKLAATLYSNFTNIIANCSGDNGLALSWGSAHNNFFGIVTNGNFHLEGVWVEPSSNDYNKFYGITAHGNGTRDIYLDNGSHYNEFYGADVGILETWGDSTNEFYGLNATTIRNGNGSIIVRASDLSPQPNLLINPAPTFSQENIGSSVALAANIPAYFADGWQGYYSSPNSVSAARVTDGSGYALKVTNTGTAATGVNDFVTIRQPIEANFLTSTNFGTAAAKSMCISGEVKTSLPNYPISGALTNYAANRTMPWLARTIVTANVWTPFATCFPGDTTGTWTTVGEAGGAYLYLMAGGGTAVAGGGGNGGNWQVGNLLGGSGAGTAMMSTDGAWVAWRNIKLEVSPGPTPYRQRDPATELALVQRYYEKSYDREVKPGALVGLGMMLYPLNGTISQQFWVPVRYAVGKRCDADNAHTYTWDTNAALGGSGTGGYVRQAVPAIDVPVTNLGSQGHTGHFLRIVATPAAAGSDAFAFHWAVDCRLP